MAGQVTEPRADTRLLLRPPEAAERLGIGLTKLYELLGRGELKSISIGLKARRIALADLEEFVDRKRAESGEAAPIGNVRRLRRGVA